MLLEDKTRPFKAQHLIRRHELYAEFDAGVWNLDPLLRRRHNFVRDNSVVVAIASPTRKKSAALRKSLTAAGSNAPPLAQELSLVSD